MIEEYELLVRNSELRFSEDPPGRFELEIFIPIVPDFSRVTEVLTAVERRVRASVALALISPSESRSSSFETILRDVQFLPLRVRQISVSSIKVTIEGDAEEIINLLGQKKPRADWRKRLAISLIVLFGVGATARLLPHDLLVVEGLRNKAAQVCGMLPAGTEATIKFLGQELKVPCGEQPHVNTQPSRYSYTITLAGSEVNNQALLEHLRRIPGVEQQTRFVVIGGVQTPDVVLFSSVPFSEEQIREEARAFKTDISHFVSHSSSGSG